MKAVGRDISWGGLFALTLPSGWSWSDDEGMVGIFHPKGVGVLQISFVRLTGEEGPNETVARGLAQSFADQRGWDLNANTISVSGARKDAVSQFEFTEHGDAAAYWQVWHIVGNRRIAFITYTCDPADADVEAADRKEIVDSFRWL